MKLVRDKIHELIEAGELPPLLENVILRRATPEERRMLLLTKLIEEIGELAAATTRSQRLEELGDVVTVLNVIMESEEWELGHQLAASAKTDRLGGYAEGWVMEEKEEGDL